MQTKSYTRIKSLLQIEAQEIWNLLSDTSCIHNIAFIPIQDNRLTEGEADTWKFVVFGRIVEEWDPYELLRQIELSRLRYGIKQCVFYSIGKSGGKEKNMV